MNHVRISASAFVLICLALSLTAQARPAKRSAAQSAPKGFDVKEWKRLNLMRAWVPSDRCRRQWAERHYPVLDVTNRTALEQLRGRVFLFLGDSTTMFKLFRLVGMLEKVKGMKSRLEASGTNQQRMTITWNGAGFTTFYFTTTWFAKLPLIPPNMGYTHIFFNIGLHWLQLWPARQLEAHAVFHSYGATLADAFHELATKAPQAKLMYVLTNAICSAKYYDRYARAAKVWENATMTSPIVQQAATFALKLQEDGVKKRNFPARVQHSEESLAEWFLKFQFTNAGVQTLNTIATEEVARFAPKKSIVVVDDYAVTYDMCACTTDARHYPDLAPTMLAKLLEHF